MLDKQLLLGVAIGALLVYFVIPRVLPLLYNVAGKGE